MIETILLARKRDTGEDVVLKSRKEAFPKQKAAFHEMDNAKHDEYDRIGLYQLVPMKRVLKPLTAKEHADRQALHAAQTAEFEAMEDLMREDIEDLRDKAKALKAKGINAKSSKSEIVAAVFVAQKKAKK